MKKLRPRDATKDALQTRLVSDNYGTKSFWIILNMNGGVTIAKQKTGSNAEWMVDIPFRDFNRLIDWYMRPKRTLNRKGRPPRKKARKR